MADNLPKIIFLSVLPQNLQGVTLYISQLLRTNGCQSDFATPTATFHTAYYPMQYTCLIADFS